MLAEQDPQKLIDEWHSMDEDAQYRMLKCSIISASKRFNRSYSLRLESPDELVGAAWLALHRLLDTEHIQEMTQRKAETINLNFIVFMAASRVLTKLLNHHTRKYKEYGNSLNERIGEKMDTELLDILPDKSVDVENQVIDQMTAEELLKRVKPKHQAVIKYFMDGYSHKEISTKTGINPRYVANHLCYIRKKLGRTESGTGKPRAINFDRFAKAYEMVLAKKVKPAVLRNEFDISDSTYRRFAAQYRHKHNLPVSPYYQKMLSQS